MLSFFFKLRGESKFYFLKKNKTNFTINVNFSLPTSSINDTRYKFFFFFPEHILENKGFNFNSAFFKKKKFRIKPGYQVLWRFYRSKFSSRVSCGFYRQHRITSFVLRWCSVNKPFFFNSVGLRSLISPANNEYNWKYTV